MPQTHDIGKHIYVHTMEYPTKKFPVIDKGFSQEIEYPWRDGKALVLRVPFTRRAVVVGKWGNPQEDEDDALMNAMSARWYKEWVEEDD